MDQAVYIPMRGMVKSLRGATATLLPGRCGNVKGRSSLTERGRHHSPGDYDTLLFERCYPEVAAWCRAGRPTPRWGMRARLESRTHAKLRC